MSLLRSESNSTDPVFRFRLAETFEQQLVNETTTRERHRVQITLGTLSSVLLSDCLAWGRWIRKRYVRSRCICSRCTVRGSCFSTCWCVSAWCVRRTAHNRQQPDNNRNRHNSSHTTHRTHLLRVAVFVCGLVGRNYVLPTVRHYRASQVCASQVCVT